MAKAARSELDDDDKMERGEVDTRVLSRSDMLRLGGIIDASNPYVAVVPRYPLSDPYKHDTYKLRWDKGVELRDSPSEWKFKGAEHYEGSGGY